MTPTALIGFKRDLRVDDHAPLVAAQGFEASVAACIVEPAWLASPECDPRHVAYLLAALAPLRETFAQRGLALQVRVGDAVAVLEQLRREHGVTHLFSREETGPFWSYQRDRAVAAWARAQSMVWQEFSQPGVVRRRRDRAGWAQRWQRRMDAALLPRRVDSAARCRRCRRCPARQTWVWPPAPSCCPRPARPTASRPATAPARADCRVRPVEPKRFRPSALRASCLRTEPCGCALSTGPASPPGPSASSAHASCPATPG